MEIQEDESFPRVLLTTDSHVEINRQTRSPAERGLDLQDYVYVSIMKYCKGMGPSQRLERCSHTKNNCCISKSNTTVIYKVSISKLIECLYNMWQQ